MGRDKMNLNQAHMLEILSRTYSLSEAAIELGTSQPRLTQQLKAVERELGTDLLLRSPRGCRFLKLEASSSLMRGRSSRFFSKHKKRSLPCARENKQAAFGPESALFILKEVFKTDLVGLSSVSNNPTGKTTIEHFCRKPLVLTPNTCDTRVLLDDALRRARITARVVLEADDVTTLLAFVRPGVASTILPRTLVTTSKTLVSCDLVDFNVEVRGTLLYHRTKTTEARRYIEMVQELVQAHTRGTETD
jgi:DNA-binding transcriptional LysR family regulator